MLAIAQTELPLRPRTLERIRDDLLATAFPASAPATLDGDLGGVAPGPTRFIYNIRV